MYLQMEAIFWLQVTKAILMYDSFFGFDSWIFRLKMPNIFWTNNVTSGHSGVALCSGQILS